MDLLKSMTGFGRGEYQDDKHNFVIEIKAVNHRYNEIAIRLPRILNILEDKIRRIISKKISRGRIDVFITYEDRSPEKANLKLDKQLALGYDKALRELLEVLTLKNDFSSDEQRIDPLKTLLYIAKCPDVITTQELTPDSAMLLPKLTSALDIALESLMMMRTSEGDNIYKDLTARMKLLATMLSGIEHKAPGIVVENKKRLTERINELLKDVSMTVDSERILQEIAILSDKTNITEEIVRLKSHFEQFNKIIKSDEPVGRKLDFLVQELNREVNTIASKSNDVSITKITVDMKSEIEKVREQIQNIE